MATKTKTINRTISDATDTRCQIQDTSYKILALKTRVTQSKAKSRKRLAFSLKFVAAFEMPVAAVRQLASQLTDV